MTQLTKRARLVPATLKVVEENPGIRLTIRQVFYRLVSKGIIRNTRSAYNSLDKVLTLARQKGQIPYEVFVDHTRGVIGNISYESVNPEETFEDAKQTYEASEETFNGAAEEYQLPIWHGQPNHVEVWLEKQALANLFQQITSKKNVRLAPCKGYPSLTFMYEAASYLYHNVPKDKDILILYFGDFDMRGVDIQRDINEKLTAFNLDVEVKRIALTKEQIENYQLPPAPAKKTDTMAFGWVGSEGDVAWEIDALPPKELQRLIKTAIENEFDWQAYQTRGEQVSTGRAQITELIEKYQKGENV